MDLIRQQLEFEAQQVQSVMEERFGTNDEMIQRTQVSLWTSQSTVYWTSALITVCVCLLQMRAARLEQLEKELQEARGSQDSQLQVRHSKDSKPLILLRLCDHALMLLWKKNVIEETALNIWTANRSEWTDSEQANI